MRKTLRASILLLAATSSVYAGNIPNDSPAPPRPAAIMAEAPSEPADAQAAEPTVTEVALTLLQAILAIL